ncbi:MAG: hypothetical protein HRT44_10855 [Bdellovibrionales bacterium]|nr:hypothetical protein [Bdellovibrionales bacterium]
MPDSLWANNKGETELLELSADWPLTLIIPHQKPRLFFHPLLSEKLTQNEMAMVLDWLYLLHQRRVAFAGLQLILLFAPLTFLLKSLDRMGFRSSKPGQFSWNGSFHRLISPILYPFFEEHRIVRSLLSEKHGETTVHRLQDKLNHLVKAHGGWPPADLAYLCLDPLYLFRQKSFYFFRTKTLKESFYGSKS